MDVLRNMVEAVKPGGTRLRPAGDPSEPRRRERTGASSARSTASRSSARPTPPSPRSTSAPTDGSSSEAVDDHDVLKHYASGADLIADFAGKQRRLPEHALPSLSSLGQPCAVRERCRLRRLEIPRTAGQTAQLS